MSTASTTVVVGVCGGIAAYKSCELIRGLVQQNLDVHVIPTLNALRFIGEATLSGLSGNKVLTDVWQEAQDVHHVSLAKSASVIAVYPATADFLARLVEGRANDLLTATILSSTAPKILFPAMHTQMWLNESTQRNVQTLRDQGYIVLTPESGKLTSGDTGVGRLSVAESAVAIIRHACDTPTPFDLRGLKVLITAGATREDIDPVRFISNSSSGKQGFALALAAASRGADVTLIGANTSLPLPSGITYVPVRTSAELQKEVESLRVGMNAVIMCAAVSDYAPSEVSKEKIKKSGQDTLTLHLEITRDILSELIMTRTTDQIIVGFAAETGDEALERGVSKLLQKGCDIAVSNDVSDRNVFGDDSNRVMIQSNRGEFETTAEIPKLVVAHKVLDAVRDYRMMRK